jgi:anthranilate synthase component 1
MKINLSKSQFEKYQLQGFNRIPLVSECYADLDTPLSIYLKIANNSYSYLLESVEGGENFGRYSIIGLSAKRTIQAKENLVQIFSNGDLVESEKHDDPLEFIDSFVKRFNVPHDLELPRFSGV